MHTPTFGVNQPQHQATSRTCWSSKSCPQAWEPVSSLRWSLCPISAFLVPTCLCVFARHTLKQFVLVFH